MPTSQLAKPLRGRPEKCLGRHYRAPLAGASIRRMTAPRILRLEYDCTEGVTIEAEGLVVELLPYSAWREDGDELPDVGAEARAVRVGRWVLAIAPRCPV